ncbi:transcriptional regulator [Leptospira levettii]|uniref:winged helix-turn-helix transcriptional regulator n=1 Tax=Leptospira levettii TaxID=2023178 RepID=UPI000C2A7C5D|nr:helix-turn-helix domain-containing protein [Leptospira levettii]PKA23266.1 transcriptional regulator [Leptospira sp. mixed culture ATI2-C-A1]TGM69166.1 transcriptional regulator [Leptospira levettii]TGM84535.1 transcriptional regulator [Leptospira levettii]TGM92277.1 transcriptional regulator [Leptospira levettii]
MENTKKRSECPLSCSLDIFGDKWSLLIMRDMMFFNKSTFGDFAKSQEGIATNILTARLQNLEEQDLIQKLDHPTSKAKVLYKLTNKAIDLLPIIIEIQLWADKYMEIPSEIKAQIKEAKKNKDEFIMAMTKKLKKQIAS